MNSIYYRKIIACTFLIAITAACQQNHDRFELRGKLKGITDGKIILTIQNYKEDQNSDTILIKNGEFNFSGNVPEPERCELKIEGKEYGTTFFAENSLISITGDADSLYNAVITGGKTNDDEKNYRDGLNKIARSMRDKYKVDSLLKIYQVTKEEFAKKEIDKYSVEFRAFYENYQKEFIKQNPASFYSAFLIVQNSSGNSSETLENKLKLLDPKLSNSKIVSEIREIIEDLKKTDVKVDTFTNNAPLRNYSVDKAFSGAGYPDMVYLASLKNDNICALRKDGVVSIINPKGIKASDFKSEITGIPSAIAVDESDNIYVFGTITEVRNIEIRGKTTKVETPLKVECAVFNIKGEKIKSIDLKGIITATGARVTDNKIIVADTKSKIVAIYNAETGVMISSIDKLRTCCGILDFSIRNNEILIANLGAFRVNGFDYAGNATISFGERGTDINQFHGCCNPVSVAFLSDGGIVTVEKDPTRIKVFSNEGARKVEGIDELVKGCAYIPMTVDTKDNIYLASKSNGIIKCSPVK